MNFRPTSFKHLDDRSYLLIADDDGMPRILARHTEITPVRESQRRFARLGLSSYIARYAQADEHEKVLARNVNTMQSIVRLAQHEVEAQLEHELSISRRARAREAQRILHYVSERQLLAHDGAAA